MTHQTLTATHVVMETVPNLDSYSKTMSEDALSPQSASPIDSASSFPSSILKPSSVSASATSTTSLPSSIITDTGISFASSSPIPTPSSITTDTDSTTSSTSTSASPTSTAAPVPAPAPAPASQPALTKPQIAGVTVGSVAAAGIVFGLLALFFCLRERKQKRRGSDASFGNDKIVNDEPRTPSPPLGLLGGDEAYGNRGVGFVEPRELQSQGVPVRPQSHRWSLFPRTTKPEDIGIAVPSGPLSHRAYDPSPVTPMSAHSYETMSRLLPDKPDLVPQPLRVSSYNNYVSPIEAPGAEVRDFARLEPGPGPFLRPAPRGRGTMDTSQTHMHLGQQRTIRAMPSDPFIDSSADPRGLAATRQLQTIPTTQRPRPAAANPVILHNGQQADSREVQRKPVPARHLPSNLRAGPAIENSSVVQELPSQSAIPTVDPSMFPMVAPPARRKSSKRKATGKQPMSFHSASETEFEDADSDDEPAHPQSALSPLLESPPSRSPGRGVRYPVVPAPASESPSLNRTIRQVPRGQIELNPAADRSKGKAKMSPKTPSPLHKPLPSVPGVHELAGTELRERQQEPSSSNSGRIKPGSAKYKIFVETGFKGVADAGSPISKASGEFTPASTPTRRGR
ncbi:MAG: hypothetical protein Q9222_005531 [Ikaeria aurantiellina]